MAGGLAALLDDVAAMAKMAAASAGRASVKAAGVVVDDAAVTPRYVQGFDPSRELPVIKKIAIGSIRNKLLIILPIAMVLSQWADWLLTPILMLGGGFLAFEGAEKIWEKFSHHEPEAQVPVVEQGPEHEKSMISSAIRTDLILSAEIMVIALDEVTDDPFVSRLLTLIVVAFVITGLVYGAVGLIVKMDDVGLHLSRTRTGGMARFGEGLVNAMPVVLKWLSIIGMIAMLWVGGHILLVGLDDLGWHWPYSQVHHAEESVRDFMPLGAFFAWLTNTFFSAVTGLIVGAAIAYVIHQIHVRRHPRAAHGSDAIGAAHDVAPTAPPTSNDGA